MFEKHKSWKKAFINTLNPYMIGKYTFMSDMSKLEGGEKDYSISKFNGIPFIPSGKPYPLCKHCKKELRSYTFFFQINSSDFEEFEDHIDIPWLTENEKKEREETGKIPKNLFQYIQCSECYKNSSTIITKSELELGMEDKFKKEDVGGNDFLSMMNGVMVIQGYTKRIDEPKKMEKEKWMFWEIGDQEYLDFKYEMDVEEEMEDFENDPEHPKGGDKFLGTANWIQYDETPMCEDKVTKMVLLYQMDSDSGHSNLGDGAAYVFIDKNDPYSVDSAYQCT